MRLALVTMPFSCAAMMPRLTPAVWPKSSAFTMRERLIRRPRPSQSQVAQQPPEDGLGAEVFLRDEARRARVPRVIGFDRLEGGDDLRERVEGEQPLAGRQHVAEAGVLRDHGTPGGEVARAALAEPAALQAHVLVLGDGELGARGAYVVAVLPGILREAVGVGEAPAVLVEEGAALGVEVVHAERELDRPRDAARQPDEFAELAVLAPEVGVAAKLDRAVLAPVADGRVGVARGLRAGPEVEDHGLARARAQARQRRNRAAGPADALAVGGEVVVLLDQPLLFPAAHRDLVADRVGAEVHEPPDLQS